MLAAYGEGASRTGNWRWRSQETVSRWRGEEAVKGEGEEEEEDDGEGALERRKREAIAQ